MDVWRGLLNKIMDRQVEDNHSVCINEALYIFKCLSVPGPPSSLVVVESGVDYLVLEWKEPLEPNGDITGYVISYQIGRPILGRGGFS